MNRLSLITRYSPSASLALKIVNKYWPSLKKLKYFQNKSLPPPMLVYKTNKNIKSSLVRAKLPSLTGEKNTDINSVNLALEYTPIPNAS